MRKTLIAILVLACGAALVAGCAERGLGPGLAVASDIPAKGDAQADIDPALGAAITDFGLRLLGESSAASEGNCVISPLSAHATLSMAYNGAAGETSGQMAGVLSVLDIDHSAMNESYADLLASLAALPAESGVTLSVEDSLWADEGFPLSEEFAAADRDYFGAQLESLDLQGPDAADRINEWVSERTNGHITDLVDEIPVSDAVVYLANALYFQGDWTDPFRPESTTPGPFSISSAEQIEVPMMRNGGEFTYLETDALQAVRLGYGDERVAMWVILPRGGGEPRDVALRTIDGLADGGWSELLETATERTGSIALPRFTVSGGADLAGPLAAMGMPVAFDPLAADFSGMGPAGEEMFVTSVPHRTFVAVDETGTEAAAATGIGLAAGVVEFPDTEPFEMVVDRPFLFAIQDSLTGAPLLMGLIADPR